MSDPTPGAEAATRRPALVAWACLALVSSLPYLAASLWPPAGHRFNGVFFWLDDYYQYLSFAEQASRGAAIFTNKFAPGPQLPLLVNFEWGLAGALSRLPGSSLDLGFQCVRVLALAALVAGVARTLAALGVPAAALLRALAVVFTAGGFGVWRLLAGSDPGRVADVALSLYPWHELLLNAHFVVGTACLLWLNRLHLAWLQGRSGAWTWIALGVFLGFSRPYDLAVFGLVAVVATLVEGRGQGLEATVRQLLPLAALAPVFGYYLGLLGASPLGGWANQGLDRVVPGAEVLAAVAPGALIALAFARRLGPLGAEGRRLLLWGGIALGLVLFWPGAMGKQFGIGLALPFLMLAAAALPPRLLAAATALLAPTSLFLFWRVLNPFGDTFSPREHWAAVTALREACVPGDVVVGPPLDLTAMVAARTPCSVNVGHRLLTPSYLEASKEARAFYDPRLPAAWRADYLARTGARFVLLPAGGVALLGEAAPGWEAVLRQSSVEVWRRAARSD